MPQLDSFIKTLQDKLTNLDYEGKQLALDMLDITIYLDGEDIEMAGVIEPNINVGIVSKSSRCLSSVK